MKRRERAYIIFPLLVFLWGTAPAAPFRFFAGTIRDFGEYAFGRLGADGDLRILLAYLFAILAMIGLFLLRRGKARDIVPAVSSIASAVFYFIRSDFSGSIPLSIAAGLILALLAYAIRSRVLEEWLTDLFVLGIPVMVIYDALIVPLFKSFGLDTKLFYPYIDIPGSSLFMGIGLLQLPVWLWGILTALAAVVPAVFFIAGDSGKRR